MRPLVVLEKLLLPDASLHPDTAYSTGIPSTHTLLYPIGRNQYNSVSFTFPDILLVKLRIRAVFNILDTQLPSKLSVTTITAERRAKLVWPLLASTNLIVSKPEASKLSFFHPS